MVQNSAVAAASSAIFHGKASGPTEHKSLTVELLERLPADALAATVGLEGYTLRMRSVEVAPGGQIAQHDHATRPGIVTMVEGEWIEGRPGGEATFKAEGYGSFPEHQGTVHWVYNRSDAPAIGLVCDIVPNE